MTVTWTITTEPQKRPRGDRPPPREDRPQPTADPAPARPRGLGGLHPGVLTVLAVGAGLACGMLAFGVGRVDSGLIIIALTGVVGGGAGLVAALRFEWFLVGLFAVRSALDLFSGGAAGAGGIDPSVGLGMVFVLIGLLWLFIQWRVGTYVRTSAATRAFFVLAAAGFASAVLSSHRAHAFETAVSVLSCAIMFAVLEQVVARRPRIGRALLVAIFASLVLPAVFGFSQVTGGGLSGGQQLERIQATFVHPNPFASWLVIVLLLGVAVLLSAKGWLRAVGLLVVVVAVPLLTFTYARAAWGAALLGVAYLGFRHSRRLLVVLGVVIVVVVLAVPSVVARLADLAAEERYEGVPANSLMWRIGYWEEMIALADENPILGIGLDTAQFRTDDGLRPHNVFIQAYTETGVLGLGALGVFGVGLASTLRARRRAASSPLESVLASASIAIAIGLLFQSLTENLGTSTVVWWYAAAALVTARGWSPAAGTDTRGPGDPPAAGAALTEPGAATAPEDVAACRVDEPDGSHRSDRQPALTSSAAGTDPA